MAALLYWNAVAAVVATDFEVVVASEKLAAMFVVAPLLAGVGPAAAVVAVHDVAAVVFVVAAVFAVAVVVAAVIVVVVFVVAAAAVEVVVIGFVTAGEVVSVDWLKPPYFFELLFDFVFVCAVGNAAIFVLLLSFEVVVEKIVDSAEVFGC